MTRISNPSTLWVQMLWPAIACVVLIYAMFQLQAGSKNASQLVVIAAAMLLARRFFAFEPYEVLEDANELVVRKGRMTYRIAFDQVQSVERVGGRLVVNTSDERLKRFKFLPANTSYLSTGASRREALENFLAEFKPRLKS